MCAEMASKDANCGVYFFMENNGGDCTCVQSGMPCKVEASDIQNNVYMVKPFFSKKTSTTTSTNSGGMGL